MVTTRFEKEYAECGRQASGRRCFAFDSYKFFAVRFKKAFSGRKTEAAGRPVAAADGCAPVQARVMVFCRTRESAASAFHCPVEVRGHKKARRVPGGVV